MSITKFTGDLNSKFGNNLPTPFIERVVINQTFLTVTTAVYFNLDEYANNNFEEYIDKLNSGGLRIYHAFMLDRENNPVYEDILAGDKSVLSAVIKSIPSNTIEVRSHPTDPIEVLFTHLLTTEDTNFMTRSSNKIGSIRGDSDSVIETSYDENNNPVKKIIFNRSIPISDVLAPSPGLQIINLNLGTAGRSFTYENLIEFAEVSSEKIKNFGIFAFSANIELPVEQLATGDPADIEFYGSLISPCGYLTIVEDGFVKTSEDAIYTDNKNEIVEDVMLTIGGAYHKVGETTQRSITSSFNRLANESSTSREVNEAKDNLKYIISRFSKKVDFMTEINEFRKSFIDKSSVTPLGNFYNSLKNEITKNNSVIKVGENVTKELVANPRIIDNRVSRLLTEPPTFNQSNRTKNYADGANLSDTGDDSWKDSYAFIYPGATRMDRRVFIDEDLSKMYFVDAGNFFFDYEKALYSYSKLSQLVDLRKIAAFFGGSLINQFFKLTKARVYYCVRTGVHPRTGGTHQGKYYSNFIDLFVINANIENFNFNNFSGINTDNTNINEYEHLLQSARLETSTGALHNYLALRSFEAAYPGGLDNNAGDFYKLMSFEFQRINSADYVETITEETAESDIEKIALIEEIYNELRTFYDFEVRINDTTIELYKSITDQLEAVIEKYNAYFDLVNEQCAFNNTEGYFNDFFVDGILKQYADNMEEAPWIRATLLYEFHKDLLFDTHGGDLSLIYEAASKQSELIAPETGTKEQVEEFKINLGKLFEDYYDNTNNNAEQDSDSPAKRYSDVIALGDEIIFGSPGSGDDNAPWREFGITPDGETKSTTTSRYLYEDLPAYVSDGAFDLEDYIEEQREVFGVGVKTVEEMILTAITTDIKSTDFDASDLAKLQKAVDNDGLYDEEDYIFINSSLNDHKIQGQGPERRYHWNNGVIENSLVITEYSNGTAYPVFSTTVEGLFFYINKEATRDYSGSYRQTFVKSYNAWAFANSKSTLLELFEAADVTGIETAIRLFGVSLLGSEDNGLDNMIPKIYGAVVLHRSADSTTSIGTEDDFGQEVLKFWESLISLYVDIAVKNYTDDPNDPAAWIT
tara:strand:+ start:23198 stop:26473 length:3276 start_codon:yes stop_codon:yes gene_type:complete